MKKITVRQMLDFYDNTLRKTVRNKDKLIRFEMRKSEYIGYIVKVLNRLHFIKACYSGMSIKEAAELNGVSYSNAYVWFNRWNEEGPEGIIPKYAGGRPSYLTSDEKSN